MIEIQLDGKKIGGISNLEFQPYNIHNEKKYYAPTSVKYTWTISPKYQLL